MLHLTYITYIVSALLFPTQGRMKGANSSKKKKKSLDELEAGTLQGLLARMHCVPETSICKSLHARRNKSHVMIPWPTWRRKSHSAYQSPRNRV